jgi:hypothetical protein
MSVDLIELLRPFVWHSFAPSANPPFPGGHTHFDFDCNEMIFERVSPTCYRETGSPCLVDQERGGIVMA